jgi:hypothetical protein
MGSAADEPAGEDEEAGPVVRELRPEDVIDPDAPGRRLGPRGGTTRRRGDDDEPPPLLPGQAGGSGASQADADAEDSAEEAATPSGDVDVGELGLPTDAEAQLRYLANSYRGVGKKTAEALVENFGEELFSVLHSDPDRVRSVVPAARAEALLEAWREDFARRAGSAPSTGDEGSSRGGRGRGRRGRRGRGGRNG